MHKDFNEAARLFRLGANQGDACSQFGLAKCLYYGRGCRKDVEESLKWRRKAAENGDRDAAYAMGDVFEHGTGVRENKSEAEKWYRIAARRSHPLAKVKLNGSNGEWLFDEGWPWTDEDLQMDKTIAVKLRKRAEGLIRQKDERGGFLAYMDATLFNDADAMFCVGECLRSGKGVTKNETEAVKWYRKAAEQGNVHAQNRLGFSYLKGNGVAKNATEAVKWLRKVAEQGDAVAQNALGYCHEQGNGVAKNYEEALKWYRKAAGQGNVYAQRSLGYYYLIGRSVVKDHVEAVKWFRKAAEQGHAQAQYDLGCRYANGEGVAKDMKEAVKWYRKAAEQGNANAQYNLGFMYYHGLGVLQDETEATRWCRKAAEQGHADAKHDLSVIYNNGKGVAQNKAEVAVLYRKATAGGVKNTEKSLARSLAAGKELQGKKREETRRCSGSETNVSDSAAVSPLPSSRSVVSEQLAMAGIQLGFDQEKKRIVVVETRRLAMKRDRQKESSSLKESYDFREDAGDDFETKRFKAVWKAYADGVVQIAHNIDGKTECRMEDGNTTACSRVTCEFKRVEYTKAVKEVKATLGGVVTVTMAESFNGEEYEVTVAVGQSVKKEIAYGAYKSGKTHPSPGKYSLKEWIDARSLSGIICPQSFVDKDGVWWRVAGVPVTVDSLSGNHERSVRIEKAKKLAVSAAMRTISVDVMATCTLSSVSGTHDGERVEREVKIKSISEGSMFDASKVKWFDIESNSPVTGKVILVVCAIREDPESTKRPKTGGGL